MKATFEEHFKNATTDGAKLLYGRRIMALEIALKELKKNAK